jgi:cysteinyl-tRNA synthetase
MDRLNILRPSISCRATGHIIDMIEHIKKLIEKGFAYVTNENNVYFDVKKFKDYGKLSGRRLEDAKEGERIEIAGDKKNKEDFALWKKADENHLMQWDSPWGKGYPGWHIECSVMSTKYIGDTLDIHGGGLDNIFPHHECEIAQAEAYTGKPFTRFFIHNNMLTVDGTKMGKSLGNFIMLNDLFKNTDPLVLRFYILMGHYRSPLDFTFDALEAAKAGYERIKKSVFALQKFIENQKISDNKIFNDVEKLKNEFLESMDDDFNTSKAIAVLYEILKLSNIELSKSQPDISKLISINNLIKETACDILGFKFDNIRGNENIEDKLIEYILKIRSNYRAEKNFKMSDEIRDELLKLNITIKDGKDGTTFTRG